MVEKGGEPKRANRRFPWRATLALLLTLLAPEFEPRDIFGAYDPVGRVLKDWLSEINGDGADWAISGLFVMGFALIYFAVIYALIRLVVFGIRRIKHRAAGSRP